MTRNFSTPTTPPPKITKKDLNTSNKDINQSIKALLKLIKHQFSEIAEEVTGLGGNILPGKAKDAQIVQRDGNVAISCRKDDEKLAGLSDEVIKKLSESTLATRQQVQQILSFIRDIFTNIQNLVLSLSNAANLAECKEIITTASRGLNRVVFNNRVLVAILEKCEDIKEAELVIKEYGKGLSLDVYTYIALLKIAFRTSGNEDYIQGILKRMNCIKGAGNGVEFQYALKSLLGEMGTYTGFIREYVNGLPKDNNNLKSLLEKQQPKAIGAGR
ncbi:MAG: hypothetical protein PHE25_04480, partial [Candidatus Gracilibacteria bacterium]|nr:hypothetical protein [Candidatus Gracilibacteria bacterium]